MTADYDDDPVRGDAAIASPRSRWTGRRCSTPSTGSMCEEIRDAWRGRQGRSGRARGRGAGRRRPGLLRRARHVEAVRPARRRLEPRGPGRAAEPQVAAGLEAGRVRGPRHLHGRRLLPRQRIRRRDLLERRHVLRFPRHLRDGVGARAHRPDAPHRARRDAAHRACPATTSGSAPRRRCASASSPRSWTRDALWARAHEIAAGIAAKPTAATQGTVRAIWESLDRPYRAAMEQGLHLHPARQPHRDGRGGGARRRPDRRRGSGSARRSGPSGPSRELR